MKKISNDLLYRVIFERKNLPSGNYEFESIDIQNLVLKIIKLSKELEELYKELQTLLIED